MTRRDPRSPFSHHPFKFQIGRGRRSEKKRNWTSFLPHNKSDLLLGPPKPAHVFFSRISPFKSCSSFFQWTTGNESQGLGYFQLPKTPFSSSSFPTGPLLLVLCVCGPPKNSLLSPGKMGPPFFHLHLRPESSKLCHLLS